MTTSQERRAVPRTAVTITIRSVHADGGVDELTWNDGEIVTSRLGPGGTQATRRSLRVTPDGEIEVHDGEGGADRTPAGGPPTVQRSTNAYGAVIERTELGEGLVVEQSFDDDGRLSEVRLRGPWGVEALSLLPDGGRQRSWRFVAHGRQAWDAGGRCIEDEVRFG